MRKRKTFQELTIKDNFMFCAVMMNPENCRKFLEVVLHMHIEHVDVDQEHSLQFHPDYHGVRLDIYAEDENHTHYNVEMQVLETQVCKRARYYHSQMDMEVLLPGMDYDRLTDSYVIFVCDFDPLGCGRYVYTV